MEAHIYGQREPKEEFRSMSGPDLGTAENVLERQRVEAGSQ